MTYHEPTIEVQVENITLNQAAANARNIAFDSEIARRIAVRLAAGESFSDDELPTGYRIVGNTLCNVNGHAVAVAGHGVDIAAVNRSTAHMAGATL